MELNITENLEKSILLPIYTQEHQLNSDGFSAAEKLGLDTGNFYLDGKDKTIPGTNIPFYNEVEIKALKDTGESTIEFFYRKFT